MFFKDEPEYIKQARKGQAKSAREDRKQFRDQTAEEAIRNVMNNNGKKVHGHA